jgi:hypothetical protein
MSQYIGKGEDEVADMLAIIFGAVNVFTQWPIEKLIHKNDFDWLDPVYKKHKFDFYVKRPGRNDFVVEVNYKHGERAAEKYSDIFEPELKKVNIDFVNINDWDCKTLFKLRRSFQDWVDFFNAFVSAEIKI